MAELIRAAAVPVLAAAGMALTVWLVDRALPPLGSFPRLMILIATGGAVYGGWLLLFARAAVVEAIDLIRNRG